MAHDFSNILTIVAGQQEQLGTWLKRNVPDEQPRRYLQNASQGLDRGAALVKRMMSFARRQDARPEALDLVALVSNLVEFVRATVGAQVEVIAELPSRSLPVRADATQMELAVVNLALNARDAMLETVVTNRGIITLALSEATVTAAEPDLALGDYVVLEVRDSGAGMDEATLARAAEPFFTTKAPGKGTGLGLAMVRGLAVQTGGALRIASAPGAGTTVALWLPLADDPSGAVALAPPRNPAAKRETERATGEDEPRRDHAMTEPPYEITPEFQRGWDAALLAVRQWHESQAKKTLIQSRRSRFPKNLEREAEVHQKSAEMIGTLSPEDV